MVNPCTGSSGIDFQQKKCKGGLHVTIETCTLKYRHSLTGSRTALFRRENQHMVSSYEENSTPVVEIIKGVVSLIATCIGLAIIIIGLKYTMEIFQLIFSILQSPSHLTEPIRQLADSIGGSVFDIKLEDRAIPMANLIALAVYCGGGLLSAWLTLAIMQTGAKIVALTAGDRSAVTRILKTAFGKRMEPKE